MPGSVKDIRLFPIKARAANAFVRRAHYSGKIVENSKIHLGAFFDGNLEGVLQFGSPMNKRGSIRLVPGTRWNGFLELNRMAFSEALPRNSESRCLAVSFRMLRKHYPHVEWIISFADATQCGDGTIYRAAGFILSQIKKNSTILRMPSGEIMADKTLNDRAVGNVAYWKARGAEPLPGFQIRYIKFLTERAREAYTGESLDFAEIKERGAAMYLGEAR